MLLYEIWTLINASEITKSVFETTTSPTVRAFSLLTRLAPQSAIASRQCKKPWKQAGLRCSRWTCLPTSSAAWRRAVWLRQGVSASHGRPSSTVAGCFVLSSSHTRWPVSTSTTEACIHRSYSPIPLKAPPSYPASTSSWLSTPAPPHETVFEITATASSCFTTTCSNRPHDGGLPCPRTHIQAWRVIPSKLCNLSMILPSIHIITRWS